jgi:glucokinase
MRILTGDIGGTKTDLALYDHDGECLVERRYSSADFPSLEAVSRDFLGTTSIDAAAFAVAGPVRDGHCKATNLPWEMDEISLGDDLGAPVTLLNDLAAVICGIPHLDPARDLVVLAAGERDAKGPFAVIGAGTGLGEGVGVPTPEGVRVLPSEGGHADLPARDELEIDLLRFLQRRHPQRVSLERAVSGPGLVAIYDFVVERELASSKAETRAAMLAGDPGAVIGRLGSDGSDAACQRALDIFISLYGSEAGNLALKVLPTGGLFVAGGIARKLIERLTRGDFMHALVTKGRMTEVLQRIPVAVITCPHVALIGARAMANVVFNKSRPLPR